MLAKKAEQCGLAFIDILALCESISLWMRFETLRRRARSDLCRALSFYQDLPSARFQVATLAVSAVLAGML